MTQTNRTQQICTLSILSILFFLCIGLTFIAAKPQNTALSYEDFKALSPEDQETAFNAMTGPEIYALVESSDENWPVTAYDLISPENAKETIIFYTGNGEPHFNLAWPPYGGYLPESIISIGELSGTLDVSRDGGDGGCSLSYGKNPDGTYPGDSERSVPKSSAQVRTGTFDVDRYKEVVEVVTNGAGEEDRIDALTDMGYESEMAERFLEDQANWLTRDEIAGPDNIGVGAESAGHTVDPRYGYAGTAAPWVVAGLHLEGGCGQLTTVLTWGTLCESGLIYDLGTAEIH